MTLTGWFLYGLFWILMIVVCGFLVFRTHGKTPASEGFLADLRALWSDILCPIGRFFWWPFTNAWMVARGVGEVLPARKAIGWLAWLSIWADLAMAAAANADKWRVFAALVTMYVVLYLIRTYIWSIRDLGKDVNEYFGDDVP
ncbi:MAG: hypothetical protein Q7S08_04690 [bacterium]|nr:hypothetical protein [bacterium]